MAPMPWERARVNFRDQGRSFVSWFPIRIIIRMILCKRHCGEWRRVEAGYPLMHTEDGVPSAPALGRQTLELYQSIVGLHL
jgi:hypothetical protein